MNGQSIFRDTLFTNVQMINSCMVLLVFLAVVPQSLFAQPQIGSVELRIGADKERVLSKLRRSFKVTNNAGVWMVLVEGEESDNYLGYVGFTEERLSVVGRSWTPKNDDNAMSVVKATINAFTSVAESSDASCELVPRDNTRPGGEVVAVKIRCGTHSVSIQAVEADAGRGVSITEFWSALTNDEGQQD